MNTSNFIPAVLLFSVFTSVSQASTLNTEVERLAREGWQVGLSVINNDKTLVSINGDTRFPLDSTVKALACANLLSKVDQKKLSLDDSVYIKKSDIVEYSPVLEGKVNKNVTFKEVCAATTAYSDNTAANIAIKEGGGPGSLTAFMRSFGDTVTRSDRYEPDLTINPESDIRDTTSPDAISISLKKLLTGTVLSSESKQQLKEWMMNNKVADNMLRAELPAGWKIADRSGASDYGIRGLIAMIWREEQSPIFISIYVRKSGTSLDERSGIIRLLSEKIVEEHVRN